MMRREADRGGERYDQGMSKGDDRDADAGQRLV